MKRTVLVRWLVLVLFSVVNFASACPTCWGRLTDQVPAFFSDEYDAAIQQQDQQKNQPAVAQTSESSKPADRGQSDNGGEKQ